jgi:chitinase
VDTYGYDGVDLDWEGGFDGSSMTVLLSSLRPRLGTKLLTADVISSDANYWGSAQGYLDRVSAMTFDMVGTWNPYSWHNAALFSDPQNRVWSIDLAMQLMTKAGIPGSKLNIGIPFYGWISTGGGSTAPRQAWGATLPSLSQINYNRLSTTYNVSTPLWDSDAQVPWITLPNGWITFDNEQSITAKINYAKSNNLGGWIIWALDQDYSPTGSPKHPLLTAVKNAMTTGH